METISTSGLVSKHFQRASENLVSGFLAAREIESTPDNSNLQGKLKKVRVIGSSSLSRVKLYRK